MRAASAALAVVAGVLAVTGCNGLPVGLERPAVTLADVRYVGGTLFEQHFEFDVRIRNPNAQPLEVEGTSFTIDLNGRQFARGVSDQAFSVPARGERVVTLPALSTLNQVIGQIANPGAAQGLGYALNGELALGGYGPLPFAGSGRVGQPGAATSGTERGRF